MSEAYKNVPLSEAENSTLTKRSYHTPIEPIFFSPTYCGHYICKKEYSIDRTMTSSFLMLATTAGYGSIDYNGGHHEITPGSVLLIDCKKHHRYSAKGDGWEFFYVHFSGGMSSEYFDHLAPFLPVILPPARLFVDITEKLGQMLELCDRPQNRNDDATLSGLIYSALIDLINSTNRPEDPNDPLTRAVTDAAAYIDSHLSNKLDVTQLARRAYLSRPYFSSGFKKVLGIAPHDYIVSRRLNLAKRLLIETSLPVTSIAAEVGIDASSFSRLFAKKTGMPPLKYRRSMR